MESYKVSGSHSDGASADGAPTGESLLLLQHSPDFAGFARALSSQFPVTVRATDPVVTAASISFAPEPADTDLDLGERLSSRLTSSRASSVYSLEIDSSFSAADQQQQWQQQVQRDVVFDSASDAWSVSSVESSTSTTALTAATATVRSRSVGDPAAAGMPEARRSLSGLVRQPGVSPSQRKLLESLQAAGSTGSTGSAGGSRRSLAALTRKQVRRVSSAMSFFKSRSRANSSGSSDAVASGASSFRSLDFVSQIQKGLSEPSPYLEPVSEDGLSLWVVPGEGSIGSALAAESLESGDEIVAAPKPGTSPSQKRKEFSETGSLEPLPPPITATPTPQSPSPIPALSSSSPSSGMEDTRSQSPDPHKAADGLETQDWPPLPLQNQPAPSDKTAGAAPGPANTVQNPSKVAHLLPTSAAVSGPAQTSQTVGSSNVKGVAESRPGLDSGGGIPALSVFLETQKHRHTGNNNTATPTTGAGGGSTARSVSRPGTPPVGPSAVPSYLAPSTPVLSRSRNGSFTNLENKIKLHHSPQQLPPLFLTSQQQQQQPSRFDIASPLPGAPPSATSILSPSSSSHKLAAMMATTKSSNKSRPASRATSRAPSRTASVATSPVLEPSSLSRSVSRTSLSGRRTLSIHDLTKLASASMEAASLAPSISLSKTSVVVPITSDLDSAAPSMSVTISTKITPAHGGVRSRSGSSGSALVSPSSVLGAAGGAATGGGQVPAGTGHHEHHNTPGKRLPSRKSMTALARSYSHSSQASLPTLEHDQQTRPLHHSRNSASSKSASTLFSRRGVKLDSAALTSSFGGVGISVSRRQSSAAGQHSLTRRDDAHHHRADPFSDVAETILSPLLVRTGSKVWEDIRESKGQGWLTSRSSSLGFYDDGDSYYDREAARQLEEEERKQFSVGFDEREEEDAEAEIDYNPLTYQSRTMTGIEIDDRDSDTDSQEESGSEESESSEEEESESAKPKKTASFKLVGSGDSDDDDDDDDDKILHIGDLKKLKQQQEKPKKKKKSRKSKKSGGTENTEASTLGDSTFLVADGSTILACEETASVSGRTQDIHDDGSRAVVLNKIEEEDDYYYQEPELLFSDDEDEDDDTDDYNDENNPEKKLIEPSHNVFLEIVDWILGLGHETVSFSVPVAVQAANAKARARAAASAINSRTAEARAAVAAAISTAGNEDTVPISPTSTRIVPDIGEIKRQEHEYRLQRRRLRRLERKRLADASKAQQQERRDLEQGLNFDVALALGYAAYFF